MDLGSLGRLGSLYSAFLILISHSGAGAQIQTGGAGRDLNGNPTARTSLDAPSAGVTGEGSRT